MLEVKEEDMTNEWFDEAEPLFQAHSKEVEVYDDIPLIANRGVYLALQDADKILMLTARNDEELIGYLIYIINEDIHHVGSLLAQQDSYFVLKEYRKSLLPVGYRLLDEAESILSKLGVDVVNLYVNKNVDFGPFLEKMGYLQTDTLYQKRIR